MRDTPDPSRCGMWPASSTPCALLKVWAGDPSFRSARPAQRSAESTSGGRRQAESRATPQLDVVRSSWRAMRPGRPDAGTTRGARSISECRRRPSCYLANYAARRHGFSAAPTCSIALDAITSTKSTPRGLPSAEPPARQDGGSGALGPNSRSVSRWAAVRQPARLRPRQPATPRRAGMLLRVCPSGATIHRTKRRVSLYRSLTADRRC